MKCQICNYDDDGTGSAHVCRQAAEQARALVAPAPAPGPVLTWQERLDLRPDFQAPKEGWPSSTLAMLGEIADLRAALAAQPAPGDSIKAARTLDARYKKGYSDGWKEHIAAQPAPQAPDASAVPTDARLVELMKMSESASMDTLRRGLRMAISALCDIASEPIAAKQDDPTAEDYSDMLREFFFRYAAGGYNDDGGLVPIARAKDKLQWVIDEAMRHAAPLPAEQAGDLPALPEPLEIVWPQLDSQALGCSVEDHGLHNRYYCANYGWQEGIDAAASQVPDAIYDADQMHAYAQAALAARQAPDVARDAALEEAAVMLLGGSFMHDQAPTAILAREEAKAILAMKSGKEKAQ